MIPCLRISCAQPWADIGICAETFVAIKYQSTVETRKQLVRRGAIEKAKFPEWLVEDAVILWSVADMGAKFGDELTREEVVRIENAEKILSLLLEKGADPLLAKSCLANTAIQMSTPRCMGLLLEYGASWKIESSLSMEDFLARRQDRDAMEAVLRAFGWTPSS